MNRLVHILLMSIVAALLWSCGGGHDARVTAELDRADSLLRTSDTAAHSAALRQMLALDTARALQADEALRARLALLLTQAQFKCYMPPSSDSLISIALRYYTKNHNNSTDQELYTRTLIYDGYTAQMTGNPQKAMQYYLQAEEAADPKDHFNLGYVNMRIAVLLASFYASDGSDVEHYKKAYWHFLLSGERRYQGICLGNMGAILRITDNKAAKPYLYKGMELMKEVGDSTCYYDFSEMLAMSYLIDCENQKAKKIIRGLINNQHFSSDRILYTAAQIYNAINQTDSAALFYSMTNPYPKDPQLMAIRLQTKRLLYRGKGYFSEVNTVTNEYEQLINKLDDNPIKSELVSIEKGFRQQSHNRQAIKDSRLKRFYVGFAFSLILLLAIFILYHSKKRRDWITLTSQMRNEELNNHTDMLDSIKKLSKEVNQKDYLVSESVSRISQLESHVFSHIEMMREIIALSVKGNKLLSAQQIKTIVENQTSGDDFWEELESYTNYRFDSIIEHIKSNFKLTENDIRVIELTFCGYTYLEITLLMKYKNPNSVSNKRIKIMKKMGLSFSLMDYLEKYLKK